MRHDGRKNTYSFLFDATKVVLFPTKEVAPKPPVDVGFTLLSVVKFEEEMNNTGVVCVLISKDVVEGSIIPEPV